MIYVRGCVRDGRGNPLCSIAKQRLQRTARPLWSRPNYYFNFCKYMFTTLSNPRYKASQIKAWPMETSSKLGMF